MSETYCEKHGINLVQSGGVCALCERGVEVLASKDVSLRALADARETLKLAKQKLHLYRISSSGEFLGGMEYTALVKRIEATIGDLEAPSPHDPSVHETSEESDPCVSHLAMREYEKALDSLWDLLDGTDEDARTGDVTIESADWQRWLVVFWNLGDGYRERLANLGWSPPKTSGDSHE